MTDHERTLAALRLWLRASIREAETMPEGDERIDMDAEHVDMDAATVEIDARRVIVNTGWTPRLAMWNTVGTVAGALVGLASLVLAGTAICISLLR